SVPATNVPAGGVLAGSIDSASFGDPAASESVPVVFTPDHATNSTLLPGNSLGSSEHSTRFPSPSDLGNHQPTAGIFSSSSYDDDFCADVTNLASSVAMDPVATKRVNTIHPQSQIIGELQSQYRQGVYVAKALEDHDWVIAMQEEMQQFYNQQVWKLVPLPARKIAIGTKWILKNKRDARASRHDIMFAVSACFRHQVTPMTSHLNAVKKIFKYLKGQPNLGLWYPRDSPFQLEAYSDSNYARSHGDRKSTTGGCQFLGRRLISLQCKKQTVVATSSTEAEYVAAASCCGQLSYSYCSCPIPTGSYTIPTGSYTIPTGSYSFMLLDWFLL
nr:putative ribonuclease H-like domain-containing protein [Tanacetum cinerariifolium]